MSVYNLITLFQYLSSIVGMEASTSTILAATIMNVPTIVYTSIFQILLIGIASLYLHLCIQMLEIQSTIEATIAAKSCYIVASDSPLSRFNSNTTSSPLKATLAICSLYLSLVSIITLRILICFLGQIICPLTVNS